MRVNRPVSDLRQRVAGEMRAVLGREKISQTALAETLNENQQWVSRRVNAEVAITLDDLERIAAALDVPLSTLLPRLDSGQQPAGYEPEGSAIRRVPVPAAA